jgi:sugar phosphate isomerase/epimerase
MRKRGDSTPSRASGYSYEAKSKLKRRELAGHPASHGFHLLAFSLRRHYNAIDAFASRLKDLPVNRRHFLAAAAATTCAAPLARSQPTADAAPRYRVGVCDWMILKRQRLGAFQLTKEIGADGVEVDMGSLGDRDTFENTLADPKIREQFLAAARDLNLEICSLAMSGFYAQSFAERPTVPQMLGDCLDTMQAMGVKVAFLPLGVRGDLVQHPELRPAIVERLAAIAPRAEDAGLVIGVETALDAAGEAALLDEISSPAIRSYFNFANALQNGRDLHAELRTLGKDRICQIHATDQDGVWLENNPRIDMPQVKETLDELDWSGWLVIERSRDAGDSGNVRRNFGANAAYLKRVFQAG